MRILTAAITLLAAATVPGIQAQDAPAAKTQASAPAKSAPAAATKKTPAATPGAKATGTTAAKSAGVTTLRTPKEKFSYALGMNLGTGLHVQGVEVDPNILAQAMKTAMSGGKTLLTPQEAQATLMQAQNEMRQKRIGENKKEGEAFLTANRAKEGVVTLPSGLEYKILKAGTGPKPAASDTVVCNYQGKLIDGREFDSSYKRGEPATFAVARVIRGWTEALQLMPVGSKWQLFIPPDLAYGEQGSPDGSIGPGSTLIFEVELMSIQEKAQTEEPKGDEKPQAKPQPEQKN